MTFSISITQFVAEDSNGNNIIEDNKTPPLTKTPALGSFESQDLVKPAKDALISIFKEFATNDDGTMSMEDMKNYILYCGAGENSATRARIQNIFNQYNDDKDDEDNIQDRLSCQGFLRFYRRAAIDRPDHVWNDLKVLNYNHNLKKNDPDNNTVYITPNILDERICESKNVDVFKWTFSDDDMNKIKNCKHKEIIKSKIFIMHKLKWQIWLFPNGNTESDDGDVVFNMHLLNFPVQLDSVRIYYQLMLNDKMIDFKHRNHYEKFEKDSRYIWWGDMMKTEEIVNYECDSVVFTLMMELINVNNEQGECINDINNYQKLNNNHLIYSPVSKKYEWILTDFDANKCKCTTSFNSDAFNIDGIDFMMELYPKKKGDYVEDDDEMYSQLVLKVLRLPLNVSSMNIIYCLRLKETDSKCWWLDTVDHEIKNELTLCEWDDDCLLWPQLRDLSTNTLTFTVDIQIINVVDQNGNCIEYKEEEERKEDIAFMLPTPQYYEWKISPKQELAKVSTASVITSDIFELFGIKWHLSLMPIPSRLGGVMRIFIGIAVLPPNIAAIAADIKFTIREKDNVASYLYQFSDNNNHSFRLTCSYSKQDLENLDEVNFDLRMILTGVYDNDGNDMTNTYIECKERIITYRFS